MTTKYKTIDEYPIFDKRLGRHIEHDERSRDHGFLAKAGAAPLTFNQMRHVLHRRFGNVLDQGNLGSCTGNASAHCMNTAGFHKRGVVYHEADAVSFYSLATQLDDYPGQYPPDDTGSSGLAVAKALQEKGLIANYSHAFNLNEALTALQSRPVICGINWYEGFDNPNPTGLVTLSGQVRGGHEICALGFEPHSTLDMSLIVFQNSWGRGWGHHGQFMMTVKDFSRLLDEEGDVTIFSS